VTSVAFHFNVNHRLTYACRWLRKAIGQRARVTVIGAPATLRELDRALWSISETEFLPHCLADAPAQIVTRTPIVLVHSLQEAPAQRQLLLNLGERVPEGFEQFERVTEMVGQDETERLGARDRWKHYLARGCSITRHDLAGQGGQ